VAKKSVGGASGNGGAETEGGGEASESVGGAGRTACDFDVGIEIGGGGANGVAGIVASDWSRA